MIGPNTRPGDGSTGMEHRFRELGREATDRLPLRAVAEVDPRIEDALDGGRP